MTGRVEHSSGNARTGQRRIDLNDEVVWTPNGGRGKVIALTTEPSAVVEFAGGDRITIGLSKLEKAPLPPLPTDPYTVIRAITSIGLPRTLVLHHDGSWHSAVDTSLWSPAEVAAAISSFEVLSEPRAVTAKAVLLALESGKGTYSERVEAVERQFGVES